MPNKANKSVRTTTIVDGFRQSAPYVNAHRGKKFVIMLGGEAIDQPGLSDIINDIALLNCLGIKIVLVFGARPQISQALEQADIASEYHKRIRISDEQAFERIKQVAGALQLDITARLSMSLSNTPMQGTQINTVSGNFVIAQPLRMDDGIDYQHTGRVRRIDIDGINRQLDQNSIVLMGPIAASVTGESFNLTAEEIAKHVAIKINADKMIGFSSRNGIRGIDGETIAELKPSTARRVLDELSAQTDVCSSALAFLHAAIAACEAGVPRCHLVGHDLNGAMLQELFSRDGIGTQIAAESSEQLRPAKISDIGGILDLIRPLEEKGLLVRRSREQLEMEIDYFSLIERDGLVIGCAALYPFTDENMGEFSCVAVHHEYRDADRGQLLLKQVLSQAKQKNYSKIFALTTQGIHWFLEQGFVLADVKDLPDEKQKLYNFKRGSKILVLAV